MNWKVVILLSVTTPLLAQSSGNSLPEGEGKSIVERMCSGCHNLKVVTSKRATKEQWGAIVNQMVSRGAEGTDEEIEIVVKYLAKSFPASPSNTDTSHSKTSIGAPYHRPVSAPTGIAAAYLHQCEKNLLAK